MLHLASNGFKEVSRSLCAIAYQHVDMVKYKSMRVYLDNCCYNRPFDEQAQLRVRIETEAKLHIQALMRTGVVEYAWSKVLDYEIGQSPYFDQAEEIAPWADWAAVYVDMDDSIIARGAEIMQYGVKRMDALHLASAEAAGCDWFLTTDKGILRRIAVVGKMRIANPVDFEIEEES